MRQLRLLLALFAASGLAACGADEPQDASPSPTPQRSSAIIAEIPTGDGPIGLAATSTSIWVELHREDTVSRIDPNTNKQAETFNDRVYAHCALTAGAQDDVWVSIFKRSYVTRIDGSTGAELDQVVVQDACGLARDGDSVWVASPGTGDVFRLVPGKDDEVERHHVVGDLGSIAPVADALWLTTEVDGGGLVRLDRRTHKVTKAASDFAAADTALAAFGKLWVSSRDAGHVWEVDPKDGKLIAAFAVPRPNGLLAYDGLVWVTTLDGELLALDPANVTVVKRVDLGHVWLGPLVAGFNSLWVAALEDNLVLRIDPTRIGSI
jgi:streptogramin lyase